MGLALNEMVMFVRRVRRASLGEAGVGLRPGLSPLNERGDRGRRRIRDAGSGAPGDQEAGGRGYGKLASL